jgi:hypothetical protein
VLLGPSSGYMYRGRTTVADTKRAEDGCLARGISDGSLSDPPCSTCMECTAPTEYSITVRAVQIWDAIRSGRAPPRAEGFFGPFGLQNATEVALEGASQGFGEEDQTHRSRHAELETGIRLQHGGPGRQSNGCCQQRDVGRTQPACAWRQQTRKQYDTRTAYSNCTTRCISVPELDLRSVWYASPAAGHASAAERCL